MSKVKVGDRFECVSEDASCFKVGQIIRVIGFEIQDSMDLARVLKENDEAVVFVQYNYQLMDQTLFKRVDDGQGDKK